MSDKIPFSSQPKKVFHQRNGSDELDVFEAARYFSGASESFTGTHKNISDGSMNFSITTQKHCMRPFGRMSLDMPKGGNPIPLQAMLLENPIMINKEKKSKQPSSPGGKLAHFLNSLFNQTSSKKSKSKTKSTKDEDENPSGWRRKRRSSISHFMSSNTSTTTTTIMHDSDSKSLFSTSSISGYRTPPTYQVAHTPKKTSSYKDHFKAYSYLKPPPSQVIKAPINGNFNKIDNASRKCEFIEKNTTFGNGFVEKVKMFDEKQEDHYQPHTKCIQNEDSQEFKRFNHEDDGDSDSSSDLFELASCDLGYCSSGLPVYETTHMHSIKRGAPISS